MKINDGLSKILRKDLHGSRERLRRIRDSGEYDKVSNFLVADYLQTSVNLDSAMEGGKHLLVFGGMSLFGQALVSGVAYALNGVEGVERASESFHTLNDVLMGGVTLYAGTRVLVNAIEASVRSIFSQGSLSDYLEMREIAG